MNKARFEAILEERKNDYGRFKSAGYEYFEEAMPVLSKLFEEKPEVKKETPKKK